MTDFMLSQVLIGFAFCFDIASFQFRSKYKVLLCLTCATSLIAVHFWLLEATSAAVIAAICAIRFLSAAITRSFWLMLVFLALIVGSAYITYAGTLTILVTMASCLSTWGAFRASDKLFRQIMMVSAVLMMTHNGLANTPAGVLLEVFFFGSNAVAYYRYYLRR